MLYRFSDINSSELYNSGLVIFAVGQYTLFNNIVVDRVRNICKPKHEYLSNSNILQDFDISVTDTNIQSNTVGLQEFTSVINNVCMNGKWFCSLDYSLIQAKNREWLNTYVKNASENGRLVIYCTNYNHYKTLLRSNSIRNSRNVHLIQLNFPNRNILKNIVKKLFEDQGVTAEDRAIELFINRMSTSYDEYYEVIDKIANNFSSNTKYIVTYNDMLQAMKGIENFVIDDFIDKILIPLQSDKVTRNKVYRMLYSLIDEFGAMNLVHKLRSKVSDYIEFRLAINTGLIPIKVRFSIVEAKKRLGDNRICRFSDYTFRKMAITASKTSLKDWLLMQIILNNVTYLYDSTSYEKVLYSLINRTTLNSNRLHNDTTENIMI